MNRLAARVAVLALVAAACSGGTAAVQDGVPQATPASAGAPAEPLGPLTGGDPMPSVSLPRLGGGDPIAMDQLGQPAVVNFWATWCAFCVEEMPDLEEVHADLGDQLRFIGIDVEDNAAEAAQLAMETGVTYDLVEDVDRSFFLAAKARGMPTTLFVTADGVITHRHTGPVTADQLRALVAEHLGITA